MTEKTWTRTHVYFTKIELQELDSFIDEHYNGIASRSGVIRSFIRDGIAKANSKKVRSGR